MHNNATVQLEVTNLCKYYKAGKKKVLKAVDDISFAIRPGETLGLVGESGCGKSTMLNIIGGMDQLTSGTFLFDGEDYSKADDKTLTMYRRNAVGFIFQAYNLMPTLTAKENLDFIGELCNDPMDAEQALERVGLLGRKDKLG